MSKQHRSDQPQEKLDGSTSKHTYNTPPAKGAPEGNAAPGKHKRGKQG